MRLLLAAIVVTWMPVVAAAQSRTEPAAKSPGLPPIGLPLSPIGLPLPSIGLPPATESALDAPAAPHGRGPGRGPGRGHNRRPGHEGVYFIPAYGWPFGVVTELAETPVTSAEAEEPRAPTGLLRLDIDADTEVQVLVDGYFAGTLAELQHEIELDTGPHRIELRAAGYEPQTFDVRITASRSISYRAAMVPAEPREPSPPTTAPIPRTTIYYIPGCYLGNVPPAEVSLPANCDLSQLTIRKP